jgi:hypothetical protein
MQLLSTLAPDGGGPGVSGGGREDFHGYHGASDKAMREYFVILVGGQVFRFYDRRQTSFRANFWAQLKLVFREYESCCSVVVIDAGP